MPKGVLCYEVGRMFCICTDGEECIDKRGVYRSLISGHRFKRGSKVILLKRIDDHNFLAQDAHMRECYVGPEDLISLE